MTPEICQLDDIFICGQRTSLTNNLSTNSEISKQFWVAFNQKIIKYRMSQQSNWAKYAITIRSQQGYTYFCGIPSNGIYPDEFEIYKIPRGNYLKFIHQGPMSLLKESVREIFEHYLPTHSHQVASHEFIYYERYADGFQYEKVDSIIELYIPLMPTPRKEMEFVPAKSLLSGGTNIGPFSWFGMDFNMNLYRGCSHGCIYCDSRSKCYQNTNFDIVKGKANALVILEDQLRKKRKKGVIGIGAMSDTYNPLEKKYEITKGALELIERYGYGVGIDTKSDLVIRDLALIKRISQQYPSIVKMTITTADDELCSIIEPNVCVSSKRFDAIRKLSDAGIYVGILLMPILPFINDTEENIKAIVRLAHDAHAHFIYPAFGVTLRDNQRDNYYKYLDQYFPGKRRLYENHYLHMYSCDSPNAKFLYNIFKKECQRYGIRYRMNDIIKGYKVDPNEQLAFGI